MCPYCRKFSFQTSFDHRFCLRCVCATIIWPKRLNLEQFDSRWWLQLSPVGSYLVGNQDENSVVNSQNAIVARAQATLAVPVDRQKIISWSSQIPSLFLINGLTFTGLLRGNLLFPFFLVETTNSHEIIRKVTRFPKFPQLVNELYAAWRFEAKAAKNPKEFDLESVVTEAMGGDENLKISSYL